MAYINQHKMCIDVLSLPFLHHQNVYVVICQSAFNVLFLTDSELIFFSTKK